MRKAGVLSILIAVILLAIAVRAEAQQTGKAARIGYLDNSTAAGSADLLDDFRKRMIQLNWIEGKNLTIEYRYAEGKALNRLSELAVELARLKSDVIVVADTSAAMAAKKATSTIPIVMASVGDPVARGLVANLARPGGILPGLQASPTN
jgi:putative tryptophan/tyrosine transport system substrate-binding protein